MVLDGFDAVKALKAIAMGNYSRRRKLKWLFEFCVFLFLVSRRSTWFSFVGPLFSHVFRRLVVVLNSHVYVFMFFNAVIFVVYSLSDLTDNKSGSNRNDAESRIDGHRQPSHGTAAVGESQESLVASDHDSVAEILVVGEKNTVSPVNEVAIAATPPAAEGPTGPTPTSPVLHSNSTTETTEIITETKRYRRTESERYEEHRETNKFRRSKTEIRRESGGEALRLSSSVDEMDIDDFNRTVESFIAEQKLHQREEFRLRAFSEGDGSGGRDLFRQLSKRI